MSLIPPKASSPKPSPPKPSPLGSAANPIIIDESEVAIDKGNKRASDESEESPTKRSRAGSEPREEDATTGDVMVAHAHARMKRLLPEIRMQPIADPSNYDLKEHNDAEGKPLKEIVKRLLVLDLVYTETHNGKAFYLPTSLGKDNKVDLRDPNVEVFYYVGSWWFHFDYDFGGKHIHQVKRTQLRLGITENDEPLVIIDPTYCLWCYGKKI